MLAVSDQEDVGRKMSPFPKRPDQKMPPCCFRFWFHPCPPYKRVAQFLKLPQEMTLKILCMEEKTKVDVGSELAEADLEDLKQI